MKKIYQIFLWSFFYSTPYVLFASDTLFVVTNKGNYLLDVSTKSLRPVSENDSYNPIFSTEGLAYFTKSKSHKIEYAYQRKNNFDWWTISLVSDGISSEIVNFDSKPYRSGYILYPLSWNYDYSSLYFFSTNGDALGNEQGVYEYDLKKKKMISRLPKFSYIEVPLVNQTRTKFYFLREEEKGLSIVSYDCRKHKEAVLFSGLQIVRFGILNASLTYNSLPSCATDISQPPLYSPFGFNVDFCVTRMGFDDVLVCNNACEYQLPLCSEMPYCEGHCQTGCVNCRDAVDMDVLNAAPSQKIVAASFEGFVIRAQTSCPAQGMGQGYGFGYHVVIRHGEENDENAPETLYAHLSEIFVDEGDFVSAGQGIGMLGNSQAVDCTGDAIFDCDCENEANEHLHYEYHSGNGFLYSTTDIFAPTFEDIGQCVPQPNNSYTSENNLQLENSYPVAGNYTVDSVISECNGITYMTVSDIICEDCSSVWHVNGYIIGDEFINFPITEYITSGENFFIYHIVTSNSLPLSSMELILFEVADDFFDYSCIAQYDCFSLDLSNDQIVNTWDVMILIGMFGTENISGDINQDGFVNSNDVSILVNNFGQICDD